jgi:hypothetical protein
VFRTRNYGLDNNIKIILRKLRCGVVDCNQLIRDRVLCDFCEHIDRAEQVQAVQGRYSIVHVAGFGALAPYFAVVLKLMHT